MMLSHRYISEEVVNDVGAGKERGLYAMQTVVGGEAKRMIK